MTMRDGTPFPPTTTVDLVEIITDIHRQASHADIMAKLRAKCNDTDTLQNSVDLAMRLLVMIDVGVFNNTYTGREEVTWIAGTLADFLKTFSLFDARPVIPCDGIKLENNFHVYSIERIGGLGVQLTTNLYDHLLLREDIRVVYIFHHVAFLQSHKRCVIQSEVFPHKSNHYSSSSVFPDGFIEETLQTLAVLFPKSNRQVQKWYKKKAKLEELDFAVLRGCHPCRRIDEYTYWRDRLVMLKEAFDDSRPRTFAQFWHDRRDATQWYAVWIAVFFAVFFGLVQSVVGIMQLYKEYHPLPG